MRPEPQEITNWLIASADLKFCEGVRDAINKDPNRQAEVKRDGLICQVVDYSKPIRAKSHSKDADHNIIIGWEPMERDE